MTTTTPETSGYLRDILAQPQQLLALEPDAVAAAVAAIGPDRHRRILLTGMGASHAALRPLWLTLVAAGRAAWLLDSAEVLASCLPLIEAETLVIAASQSGRSAELVRLADEVAARGATLLAVTNTPDSPLARAAAAVVDIRAGEENTVSTKTYVNTLGAGLLLGRAITGRLEAIRLDRASAALERYLEDWRTHIAELRAAFGLPERLYFLARGTALAAAECGALVTKEAAKWPVEAMSAAQFRHGPLELADPGLTVLLLAGADENSRDLNRALEADLGAHGARTFWLDSGTGAGPLVLPEVAVELRPLLEIVPLQLLSIAIAEQSGVAPGEFRHLGKVTTVL